MARFLSNINSRVGSGFKDTAAVSTPMDVYEPNPMPPTSTSETVLPNPMPPTAPHIGEMTNDLFKDPTIPKTTGEVHEVVLGGMDYDSAVKKMLKNAKKFYQEKLAKNTFDSPEQEEKYKLFKTVSQRFAKKMGDRDVINGVNDFFDDRGGFTGVSDINARLALTPLEKTLGKFYEKRADDYFKRNGLTARHDPQSLLDHLFSDKNVLKSDVLGTGKSSIAKNIYEEVLTNLSDKKVARLAQDIYDSTPQKERSKLGFTLKDNPAVQLPGIAGYLSNMHKSRGLSTKYWDHLNSKVGGDLASEDVLRVLANATSHIDKFHEQGALSSLTEDPDFAKERFIRRKNAGGNRALGEALSTVARQGGFDIGQKLRNVKKKYLGRGSREMGLHAFASYMLQAAKLLNPDKPVRSSDLSSQSFSGKRGKTPGILTSANGNKYSIMSLEPIISMSLDAFDRGKFGSRVARFLHQRGLLDEDGMEDFAHDMDDFAHGIHNYVHPMPWTYNMTFDEKTKHWQDAINQVDSNIEKDQNRIFKELKDAGAIPEDILHHIGAGALRNLLDDGKYHDYGWRKRYEKKLLLQHPPSPKELSKNVPENVRAENTEKSRARNEEIRAGDEPEETPAYKTTRMIREANQSYKYVPVNKKSVNVTPEQRHRSLVHGFVIKMLEDLEAIQSGSGNSIEKHQASVNLLNKYQQQLPEHGVTIQDLFKQSPEIRGLAETAEFPIEKASVEDLIWEARARQAWARKENEQDYSVNGLISEFVKASSGLTRKVFPSTVRHILKKRLMPDD